VILGWKEDRKAGCSPDYRRCEGDSIVIDPAITLTIPGRITGSTLTVTNTGTLVLSNGSDAAANTVPMLVTGGATVWAGGNHRQRRVCGTGAITLQGNATLGNVMTTQLVFGNALTVPAGQTGNLNFPNFPTWGQGPRHRTSISSFFPQALIAVETGRAKSRRRA
jgi:hypothetical protein